MSGPWNQKATAPKAGEDGEFLAPAGTHKARLVAIIDLGTQNNPFQGQDKWARRAYFVWELVTEKMGGAKDRNHVIGRDYSVSLSTKALLRGIVEKWLSRKLADDEEFDITKLLGKPCLVSVTHGTAKGSGRTFAKLDGVMAPGKGDAISAPTYKPVLWTLGDPLPSDEEWGWLPFIIGEPVKTVIGRCRENHGGNGAANSSSAKQEAPHVPAELAPAGLDELGF